MASFLVVTAAASSLAREPSLAIKLERAGYTAVPLRRTGANHHYLFASISERKISCLIDSGWSFTTVSSARAADWDNPGLIKDLRLGPLTLQGVKARSRELRRNGQPAPHELILGAEFLAERGVILDVGRNRIYLPPQQSSDFNPPNLSQFLTSAGWQRIQLDYRRPGVWTCRATVEGREAKLVVDTGASWSFLDERFAARLDSRAVPSIHRVLMPTDALPQPVAVIELSTWQLDQTQMRSIGFAVLDLSSLGVGVQGTVVDDSAGLLGNSELIRYAAILDCSGHALFVRRR